ncbi:MAG: hypothetical protein A2Y93_09585 [Chloroflexi bacterium RBG_13_68_17]|nr:MAG: hypothetical protein A2Y93_09585 [Chloroflexi bacterium RBG_13_68_17]
MAETEEILYCDRCGAEIVGAPVVQDDRQHCCLDCAEGRECDCGLLLEDDRRGQAGSLGE